MSENTENRTTSLRVSVQSVDNEPLSNSCVIIESIGVKKFTTELHYNKKIDAFTVSSIKSGEYKLRITCSGFEGQDRQIVVKEGLNEELFILGKPGVRYYYRGKVKVPFKPVPDLIAIMYKSPAKEQTFDQLDYIRKQWKLEEYRDIPKEAYADGARIYKTDANHVHEILSALKEVREISHAGVLIGIRDRSISFLTNELILRFKLNVSEDKVKSRLAEMGLSLLRRIPYIENAYHVAATGPATYEMLDIAERLAEWDDVDWVEPNLVTTVELDQVIPNDFLWPGVWDRQLVDTPGAWTHLKKCGLNPFGSPDIIIAFVDQGIQSTGGIPMHPEFYGEVSNGTSKVYVLYDFRNLVPNNDAVLGDHGMGVSGVGSAKTNNDSVVAGQDEGIAGAAPGCRVMGLIFPSKESEQLDMYVWAAGFDPGSTLAGFPDPINPGADVFSTSIGFGAGAPISGQAAATFDFLVNNGRGGRGCLCFFSAGNANNNFTTYRPWAAYKNTFGMAASTIDDDGITEIRAPYSGYGPTELCAPSHDEFVGSAPLHNPPANYGTWSADLVGTGNLIGHAGVQTILTVPAAVGDIQLTVANAFNFINGSQILVGLPGTPGSEPSTITGVPNVVANTIPVNPLINPHPAGTAVMYGANDYKNNFGGTSSATPLAAGVASLVLSACPELTFIQARQILRDTAVKFDLNNADPIGEWIDEDSNPSRITGKPPVFSQWYGYGRINAEASVRKALTMKDKKHEEEKKMYRYYVKFVCGKSEGDILSAGRYFTAINIHNPSEGTATISKKISTALPAETSGHVIDAGKSKLGPCESYEIDCPDIYRQARMTPCCLLKGFLVLESDIQIEVVAVYTASGADKEVETIHTERVPAVEVKEDEKEKPKLPDLLPIKPYPPGPPTFPSNFCKSRKELAIIVRNQGQGPALASKLQVEFLDCGKIVMSDVPPLGPGEDSPIIIVTIPDGCWRGEKMEFRITANATMAFGEVTTANNMVKSSCVIHQ